MNILPFVITMLMLLALLTYARLETYRDSVTLQAVFKHYMQKLEREGLNKREIAWYELKHATSKKGEVPAKDKKTKSTASSRLSLYALVNTDDKAPAQKQLADSIELAKKLIFVLYAHQPFFIEMEQQRPGFVDEILSKISLATAALPQDQKITKTQDLANLTLGDIQLNEAFYKMLKGTPKPNEQEQRPSEEIEDSQIKQMDEEAVEPHSHTEPLIPKPQINNPGYPSLLDYITIKNSTGIRVYLASKPLLIAMFGEGTAEGIISFRNELYQQVNNEAITPQEATTQFQDRFGTTLNPPPSGTSGTGGSTGTGGTASPPATPGAASNFDFTVSKTNPKIYD